MKRLVRKAEETIKLLHGTSSKYIDSILTEGLLPEGFTGNAMFNYNDYGRKGEPKHPDCVYLTNDLENATRYSTNSVKHNGGFPFIVEVEVSTSALTWDDDAFYKNYGDFDFGEKDESNVEWIKKPSKELWQQSLDINMQCSHYGKVEPKDFKRVFLNGKWISFDNFVEIVKEYKKVEIQHSIVNEDNSCSLKDMIIESNNSFKSRTTILGRNIYFYDFSIGESLNSYQKSALSIKIMEWLKSQIKEFGAKITYTPDFKKINYNAKASCFAYVFGVFEIKSNDGILEELQNRINDGHHESDILKKIIDGTASEDEFDLLYNYSIDFVGDIIEYCKNMLNYNKDKIIEVLTNIKEKYKDSYEQLEAEIEYLRIQNFTNG